MNSLLHTLKNKKAVESNQNTDNSIDKTRKENSNIFTEDTVLDEVSLAIWGTKKEDSPGGTARISIEVAVVSSKYIVLTDLKNPKISFQRAISEGRKLVIGSDYKYADFLIPNDSLSKAHCVIEMIDGNYYLSNVKGSKGTAQNDKRVTSKKPVELLPGAILKLGKCKYKVEVE